MACGHRYQFLENHEDCFNVDTNAITFGPGSLKEVKDHCQGFKRVGIFLDPKLEPFLERVTQGLSAEFEVYSNIRVEPTDQSFKDAVEFARQDFDAFISLGGGSTMDTAKAANLYASHAADFLAYVNAPVGEGRPVPGPLKPHIACPTTSGTGSECTGIAIFDFVELQAKTGIASPHLKPTRAVIDTDVTASLPPSVVACSGFDVLSHALESYTAREFTSRDRGPRPMSQGANPWSDMGCAEALRILGSHLVEAVEGDPHARARVMWASTLAGIAFGNAGVHVPHAMAYAVAGLKHDHQVPGYDSKMIPHGLSVILNTPAVFDWCDTRGAENLLHTGGAPLGDHLKNLMKKCDLPTDLGGIGYAKQDIPALVKGTLPQQRLLSNSPKTTGEDELYQLFENSL